MTNDQMLDTYSQIVTDTVKTARPSVAHIAVRSRRGEGAGSAVSISEDGYFVTSAHVVRDTQVGLMTQSDGSKTEFQVIGSDPLSDTAVIKTEKPTQPIKIGDA